MVILGRLRLQVIEWYEKHLIDVLGLDKSNKLQITRLRRSLYSLWHYAAYGALQYPSKECQYDPKKPLFGEKPEEFNVERGLQNV